MAPSPLPPRSSGCSVDEPVYYVLGGNQQIGLPAMQGATRAASMRRAQCILYRWMDWERGALELPEVHGAVLTAASPKLCAFLRDRSYPVINMSNASGPKEGMGNMLSDDAAVGRLAAVFLRQRGFRRFLVISAGAGWIAHEERAAGFCEAIREAGFPVEHESVSIRSDSSVKRTPKGYIDFMRAQMSRFLATTPLGCGIFATNDDIALFAQQVMRGFYPEHLDASGVLGVDNTMEGTGYYGTLPGLSSIVPAFEEMGAAAMEWLLDHPGACGKPIVSDVLRRFPPVDVVERSSTATGACSDPLTARIIRWTWEQMCRGERIHVSDMARFHGLNRKALERRFAQFTDGTPGDLIARLRLDRARNLLRTTRLSIAEISETCGYAKQDVLSRALRRENGCTPIEFRRSAQAERAAADRARIAGRAVPPDQGMSTRSRQKRGEPGNGVSGGVTVTR
ncbi:MAG: helix-turn-helix domain-containing protein [Opitutales bacterium]|nr:helix-turn-helix domain-containing protein [Opitutales bacterium]